MKQGLDGETIKKLKPAEPEDEKFTELKSKIVDKYHINGLEKIISERSIEETEGQ